jgi:glycosyltransferase involved in cell wall biosynthesis
LNKLPVTILIATRNEAKNLPRCLDALNLAARAIVIDSHSNDNSEAIAHAKGAEFVQFEYKGGYPKKRQWALSFLQINTPWIIFLDADEVITPDLWNEISQVMLASAPHAAYMVRKGFHFLGRRLRFGGFSHSAVFLLKNGKGFFEEIFDDTPDSLDMEIHERVIVQGSIGYLKSPLIHEDFKGLEAYIQRHNKYSTWEARLRFHFFKTGRYGKNTINPRLFGNPQERRRFLKGVVIRLPFEPSLWFFYHYFLRLGFLEGQRGWIACKIRANYIAETRAKVFELQLEEKIS